QRRPSAHERNKFATVNREQFAIAVGGSVRTPDLAVEQRDLAKNLSRTDQVENGVATVGRGNADLDGAADHRNQAGRRITLGENRRPLLQGGMLGIAAELLEGIRLKVSEIGMLSQHGQLAAGKPA